LNRVYHTRGAILALVVAAAVGAGAQKLPPPAESSAGFAPIAQLVEQAIARRELPGAVVLVGRGDAVVYHAAFGRRAVEPSVEPMTEDTIFDLASLTKVVATTTSVMQLVEQGRIRLNDPVMQFIPDFGRYRKNAITIRHLLTHTSGLRPDLELEVEFTGADEAIRRASEEVPTAAPGERFVYSDINFFLLGDIVRRVSGERLDQYVARHIFQPLGMKDTMFLPPAALQSRIAPTERCRTIEWPCGKTDVPFLRGVVHDPTARRMHGVAGHAGLFGTAADLSRFCRMLIGGGRLGSVSILAPATVQRMIAPSTPPAMRDVRGLGWDLDSTFSSNRGELFPIGSFGHTGFTGTSLWLDPATRSYVVFLSNRVHPDGKGDVTPLRARVATVAAAALLSSGDTGGFRFTRPEPVEGRATATAATQTPAAPVLNGIDVLVAEGFARLKGRRVALLTNNTGRARDGASSIDLFARAPGLTLVSLFSPEHGIRGEADDKVASERDAATGLQIHSLYGDTRRPTEAMLTGIDTVVVDVQDIGARLYTYPSTVGYVMEEATRRNIRVVVLDRPNPIDGFDVEGAYQDTPSFNGYVKMPIRHGLTIGELARLFNGEQKLGADLDVVAMKNWKRDAWFDETGLTWVNPSPNMRNLVAATVYPGVGAIERTNISVGRGTDTPFEHFGAPWIDGAALAAALNARRIPGVRFYPVAFTPAAGAKFGGEVCRGVFTVVTDRDRLRPVRVGVEIASALWRLHGTQFKIDDAVSLLGSKALVDRIRNGDDPAAIAASWSADEARWRAMSAKYLLY
jgi:uncharacterized protein YbbC (DUF1343 family)/CubicO group peptidase (beta-lactamase class C family)